MTKFQTYRPEIDGLRCIAVLAVLLYHAEFNAFGRQWITGGFVGVDIFFVISGYLISKIIISQLEEKGTFCWKSFIERRLRRIMPVLIVIVLAFFPIAWFTLFPLELVAYAKSILASVFFFSNFHFHYSSTEYGAAEALKIPFLHTWSLAVEEQYYLLLPLIIFLLFRFAKHTTLPLLVAMFLLSLQSASVLDSYNASWNFFLPFTRGWELLAGTIIAYIEIKYGKPSSRLLSELVPIFGLYLIAHSVIFFDNNTPHPNFHTLMPVLGAVMIIVFANETDIVGKTLATKPFVWVGLISYSVYLWHFPIMAFGRIENSTTDNLQKLYWLGTTLLLAVASYFFIERPFRRQDFIKSNIFWFTLATALLLTLAICINVIISDGHKNRFPPLVYQEVEKPWNKFSGADGYSCHDRLNDICAFQPSNTEAPKIIVVGDSLTGSLNHSIYLRFKDKFQLDFLTLGGCPLVLNTIRMSDGSLSVCDVEAMETRMQHIIKADPGSIVVFGDWMTSLLGEDLNHKFVSINKAPFEVNLRNTLTRISRQHHLVVIDPYPKFAEDPARKVMRDLKQLKRGGNFELSLPWNSYLQQHSEILSIYDRLAGDIEFQRVGMKEVFCDGGIKCKAHRNNDYLLFYDVIHPTVQGSELIVDAIEKKISSVVK